MNVEEIKINKVASVKCKKSLLFFTRYFFKKRFNRKFIVNHHHETICSVLERVLKGDLRKVIINIAPRYGKTELAVKNFIAHSLANAPEAKFIHLSYSDELALDNSEEIRDMIISSEYKALFPEVELKKDSTAKKKWVTTKAGGVYSTSTGGQITGFGAGKVEEEIDEELNRELSTLEIKEGFGGAIIIDDPIKVDDAESKAAREKVIRRYTGTIRTRVNSKKTPTIIICQRLHPNDLCGWLLENEPDEWHLIELPVIHTENGEEKALWPHKETLEDLKKERALDVITFDAQKMQNPRPREGLMYGDLKNYNFTPELGYVSAYIDVADTGSDYLCSIVFQEHNNLIYILDVIYSQAPNEQTEILVRDQMLQYSVNKVIIESNNGGRAFSRNVERISREVGNYRTEFVPFYQSKNKEARILSNSSTVRNTVVFPDDWAIRFPKFYDSISSFMRKTVKDNEGKRDSADALTGVVEHDYDNELEVEWN